jgi:hypothetical protein
MVSTLPVYASNKNMRNRYYSEGPASTVADVVSNMNSPLPMRLRATRRQTLTSIVAVAAAAPKSHVRELIALAALGGVIATNSVGANLPTLFSSLGR